MRYLLIFFTATFYGQTLHHQMLSSQGLSTKTSNGFTVQQTIGQQSVIGNYSASKLIIGQGFQQSKVSKSKSVQPIVNNVKTTTYPNPFIDRMSFNFSEPVEGLIKILIFDVLGRLVYNQEKTASQNSLTIENLQFAQGEYFIKLKAKNYSYSTNILKSK